MIGERASCIVASLHRCIFVSSEPEPPVWVRRPGPVACAHARVDTRAQAFYRVMGRAAARSSATEIATDGARARAMCLCRRDSCCCWLCATSITNSAWPPQRLERACAHTRAHQIRCLSARTHTHSTSDLIYGNRACRRARAPSRLRSRAHDRAQYVTAFN